MKASSLSRKVEGHTPARDTAGPKSPQAPGENYPNASLHSALLLQLHHCNLLITLSRPSASAQAFIHGGPVQPSSVFHMLHSVKFTKRVS